MAAGAFSSKENVEAGETSFRVYYGANGAAVPFMWESQPGTPKHPIFDKNDNFVPPLTPPPSYSSNKSSYRGCDHPCYYHKISRKHKFLRAIFSSVTRRSRSVTPTSSLSLSLSSCNSYSSPLSWSASSTSSMSSPRSSSSRTSKFNINKFHRRNFSFCSSSARDNSPFFGQEEEKHSIMCFGFKKQQGSIL